MHLSIRLDQLPKTSSIFDKNQEKSSISHFAENKMYSFEVVELLGQQFEYIHNAITITSGFVLTIYLRICFKILNNLGIQYSYIY